MMLLKASFFVSSESSNSLSAKGLQDLEKPLEKGHTTEVDSSSQKDDDENKSEEEDQNDDEEEEDDADPLGISEIERDLIEVEECLVRSGQQSASLSLPRPSLTVFDVTSHLMPKNDNKTLRRQRSSPSQRIMVQHSFNSNFEGSIPTTRYSLRQKMPLVSSKFNENDGDEDEEEDTLAIFDEEFGTTTERQSFGAPSEVVLAEIEERLEEDE
ncbi:unnamed protein product [Meloidogyne enterolobii]|uniref:Uncharacterized protein n=1 Tax=Meloidogyne enterolobii TaxID=390850 RepID=A0ACB0Z6Y6_MELEN